MFGELDTLCHVSTDQSELDDDACYSPTLYPLPSVYLLVLNAAGLQD